MIFYIIILKQNPQTTNQNQIVKKTVQDSSNLQTNKQI